MKLDRSPKKLAKNLDKKYENISQSNIKECENLFNENQKWI